ncbi:MAG TPA: rhodanese-like domain-containing protein [Spirochaetota bacterium]|nr:rhodanese-like domain-containing protein [Spirochaetota bacterium]
MRYGFFVFFILVILLSNSCLSVRNTEVSEDLKKYVDSKELELLVEKIKSGEETGIVIVDVRPENVYKAAHIPTAINIVNGMIKPEQEDLKSKKMILYCETGGRVEFAKKNLIKSGFDKKNMLNFGGFSRYKGEIEK